jgi:hypothetical protein
VHASAASSRSASRAERARRERAEADAVARRADDVDPDTET